MFQFKFLTVGNKIKQTKLYGGAFCCCSACERKPKALTPKTEQPRAPNECPRGFFSPEKSNIYSAARGGTSRAEFGFVQSAQKFSTMRKVFVQSAEFPKIAFSAFCTKTCIHFCAVCTKSNFFVQVAQKTPLAFMQLDEGFSKMHKKFIVSLCNLPIENGL